MAQQIRCRECGAQITLDDPKLVAWLNLHVEACAQQEYAQSAYAFEAFPAIPGVADNELQLKADAAQPVVWKRTATTQAELDEIRTEIEDHFRKPRPVVVVREGDLRA